MRFTHPKILLVQVLSFLHFHCLSYNDYAGVSNPTKTFEWNILCYTFTKNELEIGSFKDLAKLTAVAHNHKNVIVHMLVCTETMGAYLIKIQNNPFQDGSISMTRLQNIDMSKEKTLEHFIRKSVESTHAKRIALILGGHGEGWYLKADRKLVIPIPTLTDCLKKCRLNIDLLCFDACMMANLETLFEIKNVAKTVIAYEDYAGWKGVLEPETLSIFDRINLDTVTLAKKLANNLLNNLTTEDDPTDVSILSTDNINQLAAYTASIRLKKPTDNSFCIDPNYWPLQDLYAIVENSVDQEEFKRFEKLFNNIVLFYKQSFNKNNQNHHGLSCMIDPATDPNDTFSTWKQLSLRLNFK